MSITRKLSGKQLGKKVQELFVLLENTPSWEQYVSEETEKIVKKVYELKNMTETMEFFNMKYVTVREHLLRASRRIKEKKLDYLRKGQSPLAQRLFELMDQDGWKNGLTENEIMLAEKFKEVRNFYAMGRELNLVPGNIVATLYGSTQKFGVINKIEKTLRQKTKAV